MELLRLENICKKYSDGGVDNYVLKDVSFTVKSGEMIAIMGPSGSGKTTLLNILGCLDKPSEGEYFLNGINVKNLDKKGIAKVRNENIGFVFQQFALIPEYTAIENVEIPLLYGNNFRTANKKMRKNERLECAKQQLTSLGLENHMAKKPSQLSGGQQQRVAIARALVHNPSIILADEPTGALDQKTGKEIMDLLKSINEQGKLVIIVTHDPNVAACCNMVIQVTDGQVIAI